MLVAWERNPKRNRSEHAQVYARIAPMHDASNPTAAPYFICALSPR
jgi:hypothetical protein